VIYLLILKPRLINAKSHHIYVYSFFIMKLEKKKKLLQENLKFSYLEC